MQGYADWAFTSGIKVWCEVANDYVLQQSSSNSHCLQSRVHEQTKQTKVDCHLVLEIVESRVIDTPYISIGAQIADTFTKACVGLSWIYYVTSWVEWYIHPNLVGNVMSEYLIKGKTVILSGIWLTYI